MRKIALSCIVLILVLASCSGQASIEGSMTVTFLDVGKADAIFLQTEASNVLIDAGTDKKGDDIIQALEERDVKKLDLLIITHFDKDHVGGADKVLEALPVDRVLEPNYAKDSKQFTQYRDALSKSGMQAESLTENIAFSLDGVEYQVDVANRDFYGEDEENDFSLVVRATHGGVRFLFAGDAENARLAELLDEGDLQSAVLKVPHHGKYENLSPAFFEAVGAKYAVITSSEEEPEDEETVYALEWLGAQVLYTRKGDVVLLSDGENVILES